MTDLVLDGGTLLASLDDDRSVEGLLVPFGEEGRSNLGRFSVTTGAFSIPADVPNTVGLNRDHEREQVIGRASVLRETAQGVVGRFTFAATPEGDAALEDFRTGRRRHLSAEVADVVIRAGRAVSGRIFGAALVERPAFPSATLLAAAADTPEVVVDGEVAPPEGEQVEASHDTTETIKTERLPDGRLRVTRTVVTVTEQTPDAPADGQQEGDTVTEQTPATGAFARFTGNAPTAAPRPKASPATLLASLVDGAKRADATLLAEVAEDMTPSAMCSILAEATRTKDATLLAALTDVRISGTGSAGDSMPPQWLGKLWNDKPFERKVVPLFAHADLKSLKISGGWRWKTKPAMAPWTGNKSNVPSGPVETEPADEVSAVRWAGAHDVGREFRDFDVPDFWADYFAAMTESYARLTDAAALADVLTASLGNATTAGTVPTGISAAAAYIVDGALATLDTATPTHALVAKDLWRDLVLTPKDKVLEYLNASLGLEEGSLAGFRIIPHATIPAGTVAVGARSALTVYELSTTPLRVEGLDMVRGGIDPGLFGYSATVTNNEDALTLVGSSAALTAAAGAGA
jgi:hypothetical protein